MTLKSAVLYGSARRNRKGIRAARFIVRHLEDRGHDVALIDTNEYELPMLDLMFKEYDDGEAPPPMAAVGQILDEADGFIVVSAEYNHSVPAALKNLLDHYQSEYLYKPSGILTYSAGPFGGVRSLVNLRGILAELGTSAIPSAFAISRIHAALDDEGNAVEEAYDRRVSKFLDEYEWYTNALKAARDGGACQTGTPIQQVACRG